MRSETCIVLPALAMALGACGASPHAVVHHRTAAITLGASTSAPPPRAAPVSRQAGLATWYSDELAGRHTASGVPYDPRALTAAHRTLPFGTRVRVVRTRDGRADGAVEVVINDRGPFGNQRRIIDLSRAAATRLGILRAGVASVQLEVLEIGDGRRHPPRHARE